MTNLVTQNGGGNALAAYGGVNPWAEAARGIADGAYLKFNGNKGDITFGSDDDDLPEKSLIIVDMESMALGWICWDDSQVIEEVLVNVIDGKPPLEHELKDHGPYSDDDDGWREAASVSAVLYSYGDDRNDEAVGTKLLFKTSTGGQVRSLRKLAQQYGKTFMQHPGEMPVVELSVESYMPKVKKHGRKYSLVMKIVGWVTAAEAEALAAGDFGDDERDYEPEDKPARIGRAAKDEDEAPRGRRAAREEAEEEEAPRRRRAAAPAEEEDEDAAPAPRGRSATRRARDEAPAEDEDAAPAPRRGRAAAKDEDEDAAPAPRRGRSAPAADEDEDEAPAPRRGRSAPPADEEEDEAPAPRRGRSAPPADDDEDAAPAPRAGRGSPSNARLRRFD